MISLIRTRKKTFINNRFFILIKKSVFRKYRIYILHNGNAQHRLNCKQSFMTHLGVWLCHLIQTISGITRRLSRASASSRRSHSFRPTPQPRMSSTKDGSYFVSSYFSKKVEGHSTTLSKHSTKIILNQVGFNFKWSWNWHISKQN